MSTVHRRGHNPHVNAVPLSGFANLAQIIEDVGARANLKVQVDPIRKSYCEPQCVLTWRTEVGGQCNMYVTGYTGDFYADAMCWIGPRMAGKRRWTARTFDTRVELGKMISSAQEWANEMA